jgi:hypothetical protein
MVGKTKFSQEEANSEVRKTASGARPQGRRGTVLFTARLKREHHMDRFRASARKCNQNTNTINPIRRKASAFALCALPRLCLDNA